MATQSPQSLPSFAQTFGPGPTSFNRLPEINNSLPPIQHRTSPFDRTRRSSPQSSTPQPSMEHKQNSRKRLHAESVAGERDESIPPEGRRSPRTVRIKEESDFDTLPPSSQPRQPAGSQSRRDSTSITPPTSSPNPSKKRRVTVSGLAPPINTDVRRPSVDSGISPVVMGLSIMRDDPTALEQVRSMLTVKQKQKALIEQRRGSTAGIVAPVAPPSVNVVNPRPGSEEAQGSSSRAPGRGGGRSPNVSNNRRRSVVSISSTAPPTNPAASSNPRQLSPAPVTVPTQQPPPPLPQRPTSQDTQQSSPPSGPPPPAPPPSHLHPSSSSGSVSGPGGPPPPPASNSLPPPSSSFARRRAGRQLGGGKGKPADIMISTQTTPSQMAPSIHSAPPIPRAGQQPGRFPSMAIPSLPPTLMAPGPAPKRLSAGQVPPTPTRLTLARHSVAHPGAGGVSGRSPSTASIPIATTLVPPTPASLHHPGYTGERSAFLAPFEMFYDALSDSKELKKWLGEQLHKSSALINTLQRQQEQMEETINSIVDKKVSAMREEVYGLRVRVDELEQALRTTKGSGYSPNMAAAKQKGKANGHSSNAGVVFDSYTFPPVDPLQRRPEAILRVSSPDVDPRSTPGSQTSSPVPFDVSKRLSVSAMRLDPPPRGSGPITGDPLPPNTRLSFRERERERDAGLSYVSPAAGSSRSGGWSPRSSKGGLGLPTSSTRTSLNHSILPQGLLPARAGTGQRYSVAVDKHQYKDGTASLDPSGEGRSERGGESHPASSQRRNSIAAPGLSSQRGDRNERSERNARPKSPMDTT